MPARATPENAAIDQRMIDLLAERSPQTVRQLYYRLVAEGLIPKSDAAAKKVDKRLTALRKARIVDIEAIADPGRGDGERPPSWDGGGRFIEDAAAAYQRSPWGTLGALPVVLLESRSLAGILAATCARWRVPLFAFAGQPSMSFLHAVAEFTRRNYERAGRNQPVDVLYLGDHDPGGLTIEETAERDLRGWHRAKLAEWDRLAVTAAQADDLHARGLSGPRKAGDPRHPELAFTVEAEAYTADQLVGVLDDALRARLSDTALEQAERADDLERRRLVKLGRFLTKDGWPSAYRNP